VGDEEPKAFDARVGPDFLQWIFLTLICGANHCLSSRDLKSALEQTANRLAYLDLAFVSWIVSLLFSGLQRFYPSGRQDLFGAIIMDIMSQ